MSQWLKRAGEALHLVGVGYTIISGVALAVEALVPHALTTSKILQAWIIVGAGIGGLYGYFQTAFAWAGKGRPQCLAAGKRYLLYCLTSYVLLVIPPLVILNPRMAEKYRLVRWLREFLLNSMPLPNFIEWLDAASAAFFLVGAIVLCSPDLANPRRGLYK